MKHCPKCGSEPESDDARFCTKCGVQLMEKNNREMIRELTEGFLTDGDMSSISEEVNGGSEPPPKYYVNLQERVGHVLEDLALPYVRDQFDPKATFNQRWKIGSLEGITDEEASDLLLFPRLFALLYAGLGEDQFETFVSFGIRMEDDVPPRENGHLGETAEVIREGV